MSRADREFEKWEREEAAFDRMQPHEKINIVATRNTNALLAELRFIRWLLVVLLFIAFAAMIAFGPANWWFLPWWK